MTQHELVVKFVQHYGSILPAKMGGQIFMGQMFGSETSKRCRELRNQIQGMWKNPYGRQILDSVKEGKFEKFFLKVGAIQYRQMFVRGHNGEVERVINLVN